MEKLKSTSQKATQKFPVLMKMTLGTMGNEMNLLVKKQQFFNPVILRQKERQCAEVTPSRSELLCKNALPISIQHFLSW